MCFVTGTVPAEPTPASLHPASRQRCGFAPHRGGTVGWCTGVARWGSALRFLPTSTCKLWLIALLGWLLTCAGARSQASTGPRRTGLGFCPKGVSGDPGSCRALVNEFLVSRLLSLKAAGAGGRLAPCSKSDGSAGPQSCIICIVNDRRGECADYQAGLNACSLAAQPEAVPRTPGCPPARTEPTRSLRAGSRQGD